MLLTTSTLPSFLDVARAQIGACGKLGRSTLEYMARQGIRAVYMTSTDLRKLHAAHPELATGKQPPLSGLPSVRC